VGLQSAHQAPGVQRPGEFQHAAQRTATLLQSAVEVIVVSGREPCAGALDGGVPRGERGTLSKRGTKDCGAAAPLQRAVCTVVGCFRSTGASFDQATNTQVTLPAGT
jgi:hypothetical protein